MKCNQAQEILLTDYYDARLSIAEKQEVDAHIASCETCQLFAASVEKSFKNKFTILEEAPPEEIWQNIKFKIESEQMPLVQAESISLIERLSSLFLRPVPLVALASLLILVSITASNVIKQNQSNEISNAIIENYEEEVVSYYAYLDDQVDVMLETDDVEMAIEEYFL